MRQFVDSPLFNVSMFALFWALQIFITKLAFLAGAVPGTFLIQELLANFLFTSLFILPMGKKIFQGLTKKMLLGLALACITSVAIGSVLSNFGIALTTAINSGFLVRFSMVTTTLFAWIFLKERLTKSKVIALGLMLIGTYLISTKGGVLTPHVGDFLIIGACTAWSVGTVITRKILKATQIGPMAVTFLRMAFGLPILLIFIYIISITPWSFKNIFSVHLFDSKFIFYVALTGFFDVVNTIFVYRTLKVASASYVTMMANSTSIVVAILAITFLKETMAMVQVIGAALVVLAGGMTYYLKMDKH